MATARKRGDSWRVRVLDRTEYRDGRKVKVYKSFTVNDPSKAGKRECERLANEYLTTRKELARSVTVYDAISSYIEIKTPVLSPSTIAGYKRYLSSGAYAPLDTMNLREVRQRDVQAWVGGFARKHSAKYTKNVYMLLRASMDLAGAGPMRITLPSSPIREISVPTDEDLTAFVRSLDEKPDLRMAVMLAAFGSLRRSEICALTPRDVKGNTITINKAMVRSPQGGFIVRHKNKTARSSRTVTVPNYVVRMMDMSRERIVMITPDRLTDQFRDAIRSAGISSQFTLHGLRHYYVSIAHAIGCSDAFVMKSGGWSTDGVMKRHYRSVMTDYEKKDRDTMIAYFTDRHGLDAGPDRMVK